MNVSKCVAPEKTVLISGSLLPLDCSFMMTLLAYNSTFCSNQHNECSILFACPSSQPPDILLHK